MDKRVDMVGGVMPNVFAIFEKTRIYHGTKASSEMVFRENDIIQEVISESNCSHLMYFNFYV